MWPPRAVISAARRCERATLAAMLLAAMWLHCVEALCVNVSVTIHTGHSWIDEGCFWQVDGGAKQGGGYRDESVYTTHACLLSGMHNFTAGSSYSWSDAGSSWVVAFACGGAAISSGNTTKNFTAPPP